MVVTNDDEVADLSRMLRAHGSKEKYANEALGYNSRLDELQAALLRIRLRTLDRSNSERRRIAEVYRSSLMDLPDLTCPSPSQDIECVYHQFTIRILGNRRDRVRKALASKGIGSMVYYPVPCSSLPVYDSSSLALPRTDRAALEALSLPIGPSLPGSDQDAVVQAVRASLI